MADLGLLLCAMLWARVIQVLAPIVWDALVIAVVNSDLKAMEREKQDRHDSIKDGVKEYFDKRKQDDDCSR